MRLFIIDVLASYLGGEGGQQSPGHRRPPGAVPLFRMAERTGCCVVMLRHLNKQDGTNAMYRGGGSIGITGQARAVHLAAIDPDDPSSSRRILAPVKVNNAAKPLALAYRIESDDPAPAPRPALRGSAPTATLPPSCSPARLARTSATTGITPSAGYRTICSTPRTAKRLLLSSEKQPRMSASVTTRSNAHVGALM